MKTRVVARVGMDSEDCIKQLDCLMAGTAKKLEFTMEQDKTSPLK